MKKLAMILAVAFTMGLAASTVTAETKDNKTKVKTETATTEKKEGCAKATECSKDKKACCSSEKKAETSTPAPTK
jgi:hypothetical protein